MATVPFSDPCANRRFPSIIQPTARYPSSIATDDDLMIAGNSRSTVLRSSAGPGDTLLSVADGTAAVADMLFTVDQEIVKVEAVSGNQWTVVRGFDGTFAVSHSAGRTISALVDAWHHNALASEVKAIEAALGPGLSNVVAGDYTYASPSFDFAAQAPGVNLVAGLNVITLAPVPQGVNGADTDHYVYISAGTGTPEPVLISGGTAVAGAASGTLFITCAFAHSGSWTIRSATAGIQEAINSLPGGHGEVYVPAGTWTVYATITVGYLRSVKLRGAGRGGTILSTAYTAGPLLQAVNASYSTFEDLKLTGPSTGTNFAISLNTGFNVIFQKIYITGFANGISATGFLLVSLFRDIQIDMVPGLTGTGVYGDDPSGGELGTYERMVIQGSEGNHTGFTFVNGVGVWLRHTYTNGLQIGLLVKPGNGQAVGVVDLEQAYFDGYSAVAQEAGYGVHFGATGTGTINLVRCTDCSWDGFLYGLVLDGASSQWDYVFTNCHFLGNTASGIYCSGTAARNMVFRDCFVEANGNSLDTVGATFTGTGNLLIGGGVFAAGSASPAANTQVYGISLSAVTNALLQGVVVTPNLVGGIQIGAGNTGLVIRDCIGHNPVGISDITVGATPFLYQAGPTTETVYVKGGSLVAISVFNKGEGHVVTSGDMPAGQAVVTVLTPNAHLQVAYVAGSPPTMFRDVW